MQVEITGKIVNVLPTQSGQGKNGEWVKNSFVIEWQDNGYKRLLCLEVVKQEKWDKMKQSIAVGNTVQCKFSVSSREFNGKFYTTATCFYCANVGGQQQTAQAPQAQGQRQENEDNGLPF